MASTSAYRAGLPAEELDPDAPGVQPQPSSSSEGGPPTAQGQPGRSSSAENNNGEGQEDDEDSGDEMPDYSLVAKLAAKAGASGGGFGESVTASSTSATAFQAFIPKRGDKDFEPTGFGGQNRALEKSRKALFDAISGERHTASKTISVATWEPRLQRAVVELARGTVFMTVGYTRRVGVREDGSDEDLGNPASPLAGVTKEGIWYPRTRARIELLPEETLWMIERGALDCKIRCQGGKGNNGRDVISLHSQDSAGEEQKEEEDDKEWVTLSVQHAASIMTWCDGCTRERYQVFAYLKRQGYIVQRASVVEELRSAAAQARLKAIAGQDAEMEAESIIRDPKRPLPLVTILDLLAYPLRRSFQLTGDGLTLAGQALMRAVMWIRSIVSRILGRGRSTTTTPRSFADQQIQRGTGLLGIGGRTWDNFDSVFSQLQIVPTGHDLAYARSSPESISERFPIFYYAWRPATRYKKTDPPLPEYRIAVADARSTHVPTLRDWTALYDDVPRVDIDLNEGKGGAGGATLDAEQLRRSQEEKKRNDESYGRLAVRKMEAARQVEREKSAAKKVSSHSASESLYHLVELLPSPLRAALTRLTKLLHTLSTFVLNSYTHCPPGSLRLSSISGGSGGGGGGSGRVGGGSHRHGRSPRPRSNFVNVFPPLKAGRRSVILAIVDNGTTSMLRFGETEFHRWAIAGLNRPGLPQPKGRESR